MRAEDARNVRRQKLWRLVKKQHKRIVSIREKSVLLPPARASLVAVTREDDIFVYGYSSQSPYVVQSWHKPSNVVKEKP